MAQQENKQKQPQHQHQQNEWNAHVASSASINTFPMMTDSGIHAGMNMYPNTNFYENVSGVAATPSSCIAGGSGSENGFFDHHIRSSNNTVAFAHNQLLQYQHQNQNQNQNFTTHHNSMEAGHSNLQYIKREPMEHIHQMQYHRPHQYNLPNSLASPIEIDELIIKTEPPEEQIYKSNFIDDNAPFAEFNKYPDFHDGMLNPKVELGIKEECLSDMQQKAISFPRLKLQTERSESLPICQRCKQVFFKKHIYAKHVAESSCGIIEYVFKCDICPMSFMSLEELGKHKQLHIAGKFFCHKYCGKYYDKIADCELHEYLHHEYESFICNVCSEAFATRDFLFSHLKQHNMQQRYDCPVCRLWFRSPQELNAHRISTPYVCGKYYVRNNQIHNNDYFSPLAQKQISQMQEPYKLQDCRMSVMENFSTQYQANINALPASSSAYLNHCNSSHQANQPNISKFFQTPHIKSEIKNETDFYTPLNNCQMQQQQQQIKSQNYSEYTNDSFSSSHNSSYTNEISEVASSVSNNVQQLPAASASSLDDSDDAVCCVPRCGVRKSTSTTLQFFTFPKDEKYLHQWLSNLKMVHIPAATYRNYRICSMHFPKRCINRYSLCYWAVPTFNLGHDDVANLYQNRELTNTFTAGEVARCSMPNCTSQRGESNVKFYNFPKDIKSLIKWCQNARLPVQAKEPRHFCGRHFEDRCIGKFRLKPWAVPTLHLGTVYGKIHDNPQNLYVEEKRCCLPFCRRSRSSDFNMSLYRFPRDEVLLRRWCYNLRLDPSVYRGKNHKICSAHFIKEALGLRKLSPGAVPTLNLGHSDTFNIYENELYTLPPPQKVYCRQQQVAQSSNFGSIYPMLESASSSPYSNITNSTPNITESMDVCCVPGCESKRHSSSEITFHTIPRRLEQMQKWCHNLKLDEDKMHKGLRVCSLHFEPYCIGGCMRPFAVPTLNLGHDDEDIYKNPDVIKKLNIRETCCVQNCKRNRERDHANLHRFPSNPILMAKWCENLRKPVPDGTKLFNDAICEVHFEDRCLRNKRLEKWSIPTLNLGHDDIAHKLPTESEVAEFYSKPSVPNYGDDEEGKECCVETCRRNPQVDDIKLYRTPEDPEVLAKWAHNLQIDAEDFSCLRICNLHFESHCIGKRMRPWAIPTLNLGTNIENLFKNPDHPTYIKKDKPLKFNKLSNLKSSWGPRCCLPHCRKVRAIHNVQLFRFPSSNRSMLTKWCHNLQVPLVGSAQRRICSNHFDADVLSKKCPIPHSVPTLDLNTPPGYKIYQNPARLKASKICLQRICIIESCRKNRGDGVHLFRFPHNHGLLRKWIHNIKQRPKGSIRTQCRICSDHFEPHSFNGKRLSPGAIPTLNLGHDDEGIYPNEVQSFIEEQCVIENCTSTKDKSDVRMFRFPTDDEDQLWKWCNNLKMNPVDCHGVRICSKHFEPDCFGPKHLYKWAIPTLNLGHDDNEIELVTNPNPEDRYSEIIFKCCVPTCGKTRKYDEVQMNSFPKNPNQFRRWKHNLQLEYLDFKDREKYKICNEHFEDVCIGKARLKVGSIPTLNLGHDFTKLYKVRPEKLQNLFGKHRSLKSDSNEDSNDLDDIDGELQPDLRIDDDNNTNSENLINEDTDLTRTHVKLKKSLDTQKCCVSSCRKSRLQHGVRLFTFPNSTIYQKKWRHNLHLSVFDMKKNPRICNLHFHRRCIDGKQLRSWAVPTLNLGHSEPIYENPKNIPGFFLPTCALEHCRKRRTIENDLRTYRFPNGPLLKKWCANLKLEPENCRGRICAEHFEQEVRGKLKLRTGAVPTLNLGHENQPEYDNELIKKGLQTSQDCTKDPIELENITNDQENVLSIAEDSDLEESCDPLEFVETFNENINDDFDEDDEINSDGSPEMENTDDKNKHAKDNPANVCCLKHCHRKNTPNHQLITFGFPKNPEVLIKWSANLKLDPENCNGRVCIEHFDADVLRTGKLCHGAVPTINVGHNEPLRYSKYGLELINTNNDLDSLNLHYTEKLNQSDFRFYSLKHCRKRKAIEPDDSFSQNSNLNKYESQSEFEYDVSCCCVKNCEKYQISEIVRLNRFPKQRNLFRKWTHNLQMKIPFFKFKEYRVCNNHFEWYCLKNDFLQTGSVPTRKLGHNNSKIYRNPKALRLNYDKRLCFVPDCPSIKMNPKNMIVMPASEELRSSWFLHFNLEFGADNKDDIYCCAIHFLKLYDEVPRSQSMSASLESELEKLYESIDKDCSLQALKCSVSGCSTKYTDKIKLIRLPRNDEIRDKWLHNTQIPYEHKLRFEYRICLLHFEKSYIYKSKLNPWALPTLYLNNDVKLIQSLTIENISKLEFSDLRALEKQRENAENDITNNTISFEEDLASMTYGAANSGIIEYICAVQNCKEFEKPIMQQKFEFPIVDELKKLWLENIAVDADETEKGLCPLHYIICFEKNLEYFHNLLATADDETKESIAQIEFSYREAKSNLRIRMLSCAVPQCLSLQPRDQISLYKFPVDQELSEKWIHNTDIELDQRQPYITKVCSKHFEPHCIKSDRLKVWAIPTLQLPEFIGKELYQNPSSEVIEERKQKCCIYQCENAKLCDENNSVRLYKFPRDNDMLKKWLYNAQISHNDSIGARVCALHFENFCLGISQLSSWAIPTLRLGHNLLDIYTNSFNEEEIQIKEEIQDGEDSNASWSDVRSESINSENLEPILIMKQEELYDNVEQTTNSFYSYQEESTSYTYGNSIDELRQDYDVNEADMALEVMLEVGHVEKCTTYEPKIFIKPESTVVPSLPSPTIQIANARQCCITGCSIRNTDDGIKLHKFPQARALLKKWMHNAQVEVDLKCPWRYRICSLHFETECFNGYRFRPGTMPTLNLGPNRPFEIYENEFERGELMVRELKPKIKEMRTEDSLHWDQNEATYNSTSNTVLSKSGKYCQVDGCRNHLNSDGITLHKFPQSTKLCKKWQHNTQIPIDINYPWRFRVCSEHFHRQCFINSRLLMGSVPTLNLGPNAPLQLYENEFQINYPKTNDTQFLEFEDETFDMTIEPEIELEVEPDEDETSKDFQLSNNSEYVNEEFTRSAMNTCCIADCGNNKTTPGITLHKYPSPTEHLKKWLHNTQIKVDLRYRWRYRVCSKHFEIECFRGTRIIYGCVPTLFLGPNRPSFIYNNDEILRNADFEMCNTTSIKREKPHSPMALSSTPKLRCSIKSCGRFCGQDGVSLHRLPQDAVTREKWLKCYNFDKGMIMDNLSSLRVCSTHFQPQCYTGSTGKRYLKPGVIPTEHLSNSIISCSQKQLQTPIKCENSISENFVYNEIKSGYGKCSLIHCQKQKSQHGVKIYKFPKSPQLQEKWSHNLRIRFDPSRPWKYLVCSQHFEQQCISKRKLYRWAIPTLNLGNNVPEILFTNEDCKEQCPATSSTEESDNDGESEKETVNKTLVPLVKQEFNGDISTICTTELRPSFAYKTKICCLPHCRSPRGDGIKLFRLPTSVLLIRKWEHNTGIAFKESQRNTKLICSRHFPACLIGIRRLSKNAVPTLNLGPTAPQTLHKNFSGNESGSEDYDIPDVKQTIKVAEKTVKPSGLSKIQKFIKKEPQSFSERNLQSPLVTKSFNQLHCCVPHCGLSRMDNIKLFRVPLDAALRSKWEQNLGLKFDIDRDRNVKLVCSTHFDPRLVSTRLANGSVPTLNLAPSSSTSSYNPITTSKDLIACSVTGCKNTNYDNNVLIFNSNNQKPELLRMWCDNLELNYKPGMENSLNVCSDHFEPKCFAANRTLKEWAVPTVRLGNHNEPKRVPIKEVKSNCRCCVPLCGNTSKIGLRFFSFPSDTVLAKKWCSYLQIDENSISGGQVCSAHFSESSFCGAALRPDALPISAHSCIVRNCKQSGELYRFPDNRNSCAKWCHNLQIQQLHKLHLQPAYVICSRHFEKRCFNNGKLLVDAVPTKYLGHSDANIFINDDLSTECVVGTNIKSEPVADEQTYAWQSHSWYTSDEDMLLGGS